MTTKSILRSMSILALVSILALIAAAPTHAVDKPRAHGTASASKSAGDDCEARIQKLDASPAEGEERLAEKNSVIDFCAGQYKGDKTIEGLLQACAKYEEQPVIKQQFVAECMLAAFTYANALRSLKDEYGK